MSQIETTRLKDLIAIQIGTIQEYAQKMTVNCDLRELETLITSLEEATTELKKTLDAIPHHHH